MASTPDDNEDSGDLAVALSRLISAHFSIDLSTSGAPLLDQGLSFDSVSLVQLIVLIEEHFRISFDEDELRNEAFNDLDSLTALVGNKIERLRQP